MFVRVLEAPSLPGRVPSRQRVRLGKRETVRVHSPANTLAGQDVLPVSPFLALCSFSIGGGCYAVEVTTPLSRPLGPWGYGASP